MNNIRSFFNRDAHQYDQVCTLQTEVGKRLFSRLDLLKPPHQMILDLGTGTGGLTPFIKNQYPDANILNIDFSAELLKINQKKNPGIQIICADAYQLPIKNQQVDMVISNLMVQWCCEDLPRLLTEISRVLKPGGLFLFSTFGPSTLFELKNSWLAVDNNHHTNEFIDMHHIGDLLLGLFSNPVVESENIVLTYEKVNDLIGDLKMLGANYVANRHKGLVGKNKFHAMQTHYEQYRQDDKLPATYEVIYGHAWQHNNSLGDIPLNSV